MRELGEIMPIESQVALRGQVFQAPKVRLLALLESISLPRSTGKYSFNQWLEYDSTEQVLIRARAMMEEK